MLGEFFLNSCIRLCCTDTSKYKNKKEVFESILYIVNWYKKEIPKESDITLRDKFELLEYLSQYRMNHHGEFSLVKMVSGIISGKLKSLIPLIETMEDPEEEEFNEMVSVVYSKRKLCELLVGKKHLNELLNDLDLQNYVDEKEIIARWEEQINSLYNRVSEVRRLESIDKITVLNLLEDDYSSVMSDLRNTHLGSNTIPTGYRSLDNMLPCKGFEKRRLYLIGGTSGVGKSVLLVNLIRNAIELARPSELGEKDLYLYITGENLIGESLERLYCCFTGDPYVNVVGNIMEDDNFSLKTKLRDTLLRFKSNIEICYVQPKITNLKDIESIFDRVISAGYNLKAVYLDYLDLIVSGYNMLDPRIDQGQVSLGLKGMSVIYNVPIITATQLNRAGYDSEIEPSLTQMGESMLKVNNSDFVLYLQPPKDSRFTIPFNGTTKTGKKVKMTVLKNRNGDIGEFVYVEMADRIGLQRVFNYRMSEAASTKDGAMVLAFDDDNQTENDNFWSKLLDK
jgi:replicative DNA helicase